MTLNDIENNLRFIRDYTRQAIDITMAIVSMVNAQSIYEIDETLLPIGISTIRNIPQEYGNPYDSYVIRYDGHRFNRIGMDENDLYVLGEQGHINVVIQKDLQYYEIHVNNYSCFNEWNILG